MKKLQFRCITFTAFAVLLAFESVSSAEKWEIPKLPPLIQARVVLKDVANTTVIVTEGTVHFDVNLQKSVTRKDDINGNWITICDPSANRTVLIRAETGECYVRGSEECAKTPSDLGPMMQDTLGIFPDTQVTEFSEFHGIKSVLLTTSVNRNSWKFSGLVKADWSDYGHNFSYCGMKDDCKGWSVPLRSELDGNIPEQKVHVFHEFTEFFDYVDPEAFSIPDGVYCKDYLLDKNKKFPSIHPFHSMKAEIYFLDSFHLNRRERKSWFYFDVGGLTGVLRVDERSLSFDKKDSNAYLKQIYDLKQEVLYSIAADTGQCQILDLNKAVGNFSISFQDLIDHLILQIDSPDKFTFIGKKKCRYGMCDGWVSKNGFETVNVYFNQTTKYLNSDGHLIETQSPVAIFRHNVSTGKQDRFIESQHIFDYIPEQPKWEVFDTSDCFDESQKLRFTIKLKGFYNAGIQDHLETFKRAFISAIESYVLINTIRLTDIQIDHIGNDITLGTVTLLEDVYNIGKSTKITDVKPLSNRYIYDKLAKRIFDRNFKVVFFPDIENFVKELEYIGVDIEEVMSEEKTMEKSDLMKQFVEIQDKDVNSKSTVVFRGVSVDECAEACDNERVFECEAFTYCATGKCQLLSMHSNEISTKYITTSSGCSIFNRNYTFDYQMYLADTLLPQPGDTKKENVEMEDCALLCASPNRNVVSGTCRSFDLCSDETNKGQGIKKYCVFHSRTIHEVSHSEMINNPNCLHMSRTDLIDFQKMPNRTYSGDDYDRYPSEQTTDGCATQCFLDPDGCEAFEMCGTDGSIENKILCVLLRPKTKKGNRQMSLTTSNLCDFYKRNRITNWKYGNEYQSQKDQQYSSGSFAALAICMTIIGVTFGMVATYYFVMYNVKRNPNHIVVVRLLGSETNKRG